MSGGTESLAREGHLMGSQGKLRLQEPASSPEKSPSLSSRLAGLAQKVTAGRELSALCDQALVSGANFVTNVMLARSLGLSGFGMFALSWMVVLLWSNLQNAMLVTPMMSIGQKQEPAFKPFYFGALRRLALAFAVAGSLVTYAGATVLARWPRVHVVGSFALPLAVATAAYLLQDFVRRYFFTIRSGTLALASDALSYLTQLPLLFWAASTHHLSIGVALWTVALTSLFSASVSAAWMRGLRFRAGTIRPILHRHAPLVRWLAPSAVLQWLSLNLFMVFAPVYYGAAAAGALRACQNLVAVAHIWFLGLDNVVPPEAARCLHEHGVNSMMAYLKRVTARWGAVTLGFMLVLGVAPAFWLHLLYGAQYVQYSFVLRLYGLLYVMIFVGTPLRAGLQSMEFTAPMLWAYLAMTVFTALVAGPAAKYLGLLGVMLGLICTQLIFQVIMGAAMYRRAQRLRVQAGAALPV